MFFQRTTITVWRLHPMKYSLTYYNLPTTATKRNNIAPPTTIATILYIKGMSENILRILQPLNISIAHKPITTLCRLLTNVKDKDEPRKRQGTIYKINCSDCQVSPTSERLAETSQQDWLKTDGRRRKVMSTITLLNIIHLQTTILTGTLHNALTYSTNYFQRLTLESWLTN